MPSNNKIVNGLPEDTTSIKVGNILSKLSSPLLQLFSDVIAILATFTIQYYLRFESGLIESSVEFNFTVFITSAIIFLIAWVTFFFFAGMYKNWYLRSPFDELFSIIRVVFTGTFILVFFVLSELSGSPRMLFIIYFLVFTANISFGRFLARRLQKILRTKGIISIPAIIVGTSAKSREFYIKTKRAKPWGYNSIGVVLIDSNELNNWNAQHELTFEIPLLGTVENLDEILDTIMPSEIIISTEKPNHDTLLEIASKCSDKNIRVKIEPDLYDIFTGQARAQNIYGIPLIEIRTRLMQNWQNVSKRVFDIVFSLFVIIIGMPLWILVGIIIKLESKGPVFYKQPRVGLDGRVFQIFKFRSMVADADKQSQKWTSVGDPRVTKFGKFLRKSHIDEIPQFWNTLTGEMSIVGPRPEQPQYVDKFSSEIPYYKRRLIVRPGITGWWQVTYQPHVLDTEEIKSRLKDDFYYIENISLKLDFEIVIRTVWCVIKGHGQA